MKLILFLSVAFVTIFSNINANVINKRDQEPDYQIAYISFF